MSKAVQHLQNIKINDEWETPKQLIQDYCATKGLSYPLLDVACTSLNFKGKIGLAVDQQYNGLEQSWKITYGEEGCPVFCNPPYSNVAKWVEKAVKEWREHNIDIILLTYAKVDTKWFHALVEPYRKKGDFDVDFIEGRIKFELNGTPYYYTDQEGRKKCGYSPYPSMWVWMKMV